VKAGRVSREGGEASRREKSFRFAIFAIFARNQCRPPVALRQDFKKSVEPSDAS
jgi:hypothetical protein